MTLKNKTVLITRSASQAEELSRLLLAEGAFVLEFPTIEIDPPKSFEAMDQAIHHLK
ncbi:MAG: hypothetical protein Q7S00_04030 [bacterium]|nr:hypothetical protein [bacterium]